MLMPLKTLTWQPACVHCELTAKNWEVEVRVMIIGKRVEARPGTRTLIEPFTLCSGVNPVAVMSTWNVPVVALWAWISAINSLPKGLPQPAPTAVNANVFKNRRREKLIIPFMRGFRRDWRQI